MVRFASTQQVLDEKVNKKPLCLNKSEIDSSKSKHVTKNTVSSITAQVNKLSTQFVQREEDRESSCKLVS